eukprot:CAMPEP_0115873674 /NCGR_PEP_ID=MMETSP0287-20121206/24119_1 /TAXON_ID=412157 /ORGANISM="Chrysochromulina rotalis, Strain UIO044" /LENGTH=115 /DNA_ID=CAMNT_0003328745 /DNA_START=242 /DNA_END=589 /DNA_ORIENTATION=-
MAELAVRASRSDRPSPAMTPFQLSHRASLVASVRCAPNARSMRHPTVVQRRGVPPWVPRAQSDHALDDGPLLVRWPCAATECAVRTHPVGPALQSHQVGRKSGGDAEVGSPPLTL